MYNPANLLIVTSGRVDTVDDVDPGSAIANPVEARFGGVLGGFLPLTKLQAAQLSSTTTPLFEGVYQYVKFKSTSTVAPARGLIYYWDDIPGFTVVPDAPSAQSAVAGIGLLANTKGQYGFIQVAGRGQVLYAASLTSNLIGNIVFGDATTNGHLANATNTTTTGVQLARMIGVANEIPVVSTIGQVLLRGLYVNNG